MLGGGEEVEKRDHKCLLTHKGNSKCKSFLSFYDFFFFFHSAFDVAALNAGFSSFQVNYGDGQKKSVP